MLHQRGRRVCNRAASEARAPPVAANYEISRPARAAREPCEGCRLGKARTAGDISGLVRGGRGGGEPRGVDRYGSRFVSSNTKERRHGSRATLHRVMRELCSSSANRVSRVPAVRREWRANESRAKHATQKVSCCDLCFRELALNLLHAATLHSAQSCTPARVVAHDTTARAPMLLAEMLHGPTSHTRTTPHSTVDR